MAAEYRLVSYADGKGAKAGALIGDRIFPAEQLIGGDGIDTSGVLALLRNWDKAHARLHAAAQKVKPGDGIALAQAKRQADLAYAHDAYSLHAYSTTPLSKSSS